MTFYSERDSAGRPVYQIAMPRSPRIYARGMTMHVVARWAKKGLGSYFVSEAEVGIVAALEPFFPLRESKNWKVCKGEGKG